MKEIYLGIDLCKKNIQISYYREDTGEPESIYQLNNTETYQLPNVMFYSTDENVDPVGACVGNRGARVQNITDELFGEKIDIIVWDEDPAVFISNVLRPAIVEGVYINEDEKSAIAVVPEQQLSLAIGREGQNVRLAARVSNWKIDIKSNDQLKDMGFAFDEYEDADDKAAEEQIIEETSDEGTDA